MRGILIATILVVAAMLAITDGRVLAKAGLTGSCRPVAAPAGQPGDWAACRSGKLEGRPDLTRRSCVRYGVVGSDEYWRCPAPLDSGTF